MRFKFREDHPERADIIRYMKERYPSLGDDGLDIFSTFLRMDRMADESLPPSHIAQLLAEEFDQRSPQVLLTLCKEEPQSYQQWRTARD